jgi:NAD(P)-dependent dehydrogenase (short-subunit alcohol dehydrogenase family)
MKKTILVTGSSTGFGRLTVQTLAKDGHQVFASMRGVTGKNAEHAASLTKWAKENHVDLTVIELDVVSDASVKAAAKTIAETSDRIDVVVNNAGIYSTAIQETFTVADYKNLYDVNVFGSVRVINEFLPLMRKQQSGLLIQISSVLGRIIVPFSGVYVSTKWAVEALAENLNYELAPLGIESVIVQPGPFYTELFGKPYQPANIGIASEYGASQEHLQKFMGNLGQMMSAADVPNQPQQVADAIKKLIDTPAGERPLRTVVDLMMQGSTQAINQVAEKVQEGLLGGFGLSDLLHVKKELIAV